MSKFRDGADSRLILTYLIPLRLIRGSFPSRRLLAEHPRLDELYSPFIQAIRNGDIEEYDERLEWAQPRLVGMSTYLAVERAREGCLRVLFKKAWVASDKSSRVPVRTFQLALKLHGVDVDADEVECMLANMVYRVSLSFRDVLTTGLHQRLHIAREADGRVGKDESIPYPRGYPAIVVLHIALHSPSAVHGCCLLTAQANSFSGIDETTCSFMIFTSLA